ncbi:MAG: anaerobic ribonucleoside-triphosphate reductase, partial [Lachnospiraceae bacterium]|nr:anaerobic ribonucleoside-triphosphate reductase [Lachnospiraceae bacterium]
MENVTTEEVENYGQLFRPERDIKVVKKDGSLEAFNVQKVIDAVGKSAYRALTKFTEEEKCHICRYVVDKVMELEQNQVPIPIMHNIVESALEEIKPVVAKSYRDYRNYKQDFVRMMDDVYKKSQSIMY